MASISKKSVGPENYSGIRSKNSSTESSFCFICAPDTIIADWFGYFIPVPMANISCDLIIWKSRRLTKTFIKRHCFVSVGTNSTSAKDRERSHAILDANEPARDLCSDIPESRKNPTIESDPDFWLIAAFTREQLEGLSHALLDQLKVMALDDQNGSLRSSGKELFISHVNYSNIDPGFR
jgi:hypothetical protein